MLQHLAKKKSFFCQKLYTLWGIFVIFACINIRCNAIIDFLSSSIKIFSSAFLHIIFFSTWLFLRRSLNIDEDEKRKKKKSDMELKKGKEKKRGKKKMLSSFFFRCSIFRNHSVFTVLQSFMRFAISPSMTHFICVCICVFFSFFCLSAEYKCQFNRGHLHRKKKKVIWVKKIIWWESNDN